MMSLRIFSTSFTFDFDVITSTRDERSNQVDFWFKVVMKVGSEKDKHKLVWENEEWGTTIMNNW